MQLANSLAAITSSPTDPPLATATLRKQRIELLPAHVAYICSVLVEQQFDLEAKRLKLVSLAVGTGEEVSENIGSDSKAFRGGEFWGSRADCTRTCSKFRRSGRRGAREIEVGIIASALSG